MRIVDPLIAKRARIYIYIYIYIFFFFLGGGWVSGLGFQLKGCGFRIEG